MFIYYLYNIYMKNLYKNKIVNFLKLYFIVKNVIYVYLGNIFVGLTVL